MASITPADPQSRCRTHRLGFAAVLGFIGLLWWAPAVDLTWIHQQLYQLPQTLRLLGVWGPVLSICLMVIAILISPLPSAPIAMAVGLVYGTWWGTAIVVTGAELGALSAFALTRFLGRPYVEKRFGHIVDFGITGSQNAMTWTVFVSRMLPFLSFDIVSYAAGLTKITPLRFALATLGGIVPASFLLVFAGETMGNAHPFFSVALTAGIVIALVLASSLTLRRN